VLSSINQTAQAIFDALLGYCLIKSLNSCLTFKAGFCSKKSSSGFPEIERLFKISEGFYENKISAEEFLEQCDPFVLDSIIGGIIKIFEIRTKNLKRIK
jgi:hypothetical protein